MIPEIPQAVQAERSIIGSILLNPDCISLVADELQPEHFYDRRNAHIYETMLACHRRRTRPDVAIVSGLLSIEIIGDSPLMHLINISNETTFSGYVVEYAREVIDKATLRAVIDVTAKITREAFECDDDITETLDKVEQMLLGVTRRRKTSTFKSIGNLANTYYESLNSDEESNGNACKTGFTDLDDKLNGGLRRGEMVILGARPATGKTSFAVQIAGHVAIEQNKKAVVFEVEMDAEQLQQRLLSLRTNIPLSEVRSRRIYGDDDLQRITIDTATVQDKKLYIEDSGWQTIADVRSKCRSLLTEWGEIDLIVIDYLQLLNGSANRGRSDPNRVQEISEISRGLKQLARELNVPILVLSQLSRAVEGRASRVPMLSDLRESGAIEQDADIVMFIYREELYDKETDKKGIAEIHIAKHRNGPTGVVPLRFDGSRTRFDNLERYRAVEGY